MIKCYLIYKNIEKQYHLKRNEKTAIQHANQSINTTFSHFWILPPDEKFIFNKYPDGLLTEK